jgi:zinc transport system substrate-binding protein
MRVLLLISTVFVLASCGKRDSSPSTPPPAGKVVLTTFYPTQYFAQRIAGDHLSIGCPLPADADPIHWSPDSATIQKYQSADLIIINGANFEKWIATASLPESRIINTSKSFEQDFIKFEGTSAHRHGKEGEDHAHTGTDGHTWLDPNNAKIQAATIHQALAKMWPAHATDFEKNFQNLVTDLDALDEALKEIDPATPLLASHPAYNYLARRYGWKMSNLDLDPDALQPKDAIPADHPAKIILWESAPRELASALLEKQHGLKSIVFSPAEQQGEQDYLATMKANIERLKSASK